jgi:hypothetical protein
LHTARSDDSSSTRARTKARRSRSPEYVRRKIREAGFGIDSVDGDPPQREYAVLRDTLATVRSMRAAGATRDEIRDALGDWGELTDWAMSHPATEPGST